MSYIIICLSQQQKSLFSRCFCPLPRLVSGDSYFTTETELLTIYKAEPIWAVQTPESHFFFLHWTALGHLSSMRTTAFVLLSALVLATILSEYLPHNPAPALILRVHVIFSPCNSEIYTTHIIKENF